MSEHGEQVALFEYLAYRAGHIPELAYVFAVPNGGLRDKVVAARLQAEGVRAGVPDVMVPIVRAPYHGLFIEMKYGRNTLSVEQKQFQAHLLKQGYLVVVCYSSVDAIRAIERYLSGIPGNERTR